MAREMVIPGADIGYEAEEDLGEGVGVVAGTSDHQVALPASDGEHILGVTLYAVSAGERVALRTQGIVRALTSGAISRDAQVMVTASTGALKTVSASTGVRVEVAGRSEETNTADDTWGYIRLTPGAHYIGE